MSVHLYIFVNTNLIITIFRNLSQELMSATATQRLQAKRQTLDEAYAPPANFLEIEVVNPVGFVNKSEKNSINVE
jgi:hypothetical protein